MLDFPVNRVSPVNRVLLVPMVSQDLLEQQASKEQLEISVQQVILGNRDQQDQEEMLELKVRLEQLVPLDLLDFLDSWDLRVPEEILVCRVQLGQLDRLDSQDPEEILVSRARADNEVPWVIGETREQLVNQVKLGIRDLAVNQVIPAPLVHPDLLAIQALQDKWDQWDSLVPQALQGIQE